MSWFRRWLAGHWPLPSSGLCSRTSSPYRVSYVSLINRPNIEHQMLRRTWLIVLLGAVAAQAGHLLTYQVLFGAAAQQVQSSGAHAYFPVLVKTFLGAAAAIV